MLKKFLKSSATAGITIVVSVLIIVAIVQAGNITPPSGTPTAKFYSLSEIYEFIANNTTATEGGHDFTFSDSLAGTSRTLTEIYGALAGLISADKVKTGTTYLGVDGTLAPDGTAAEADCLNSKTFYSGDSWTQKTGSLAAQALSADSATVSAGFYNATTLPTVDSDLATANIKSGTTIFGIAGDSNVVNTSSGDAAITDILSGKKAWVDGQEITGSIANCSSEGSQSCYVAGSYYAGTQQSIDNATTSQSAGYYSAFDLVINGDADLAAGNIKSGSTIFGIAGDSNVADTSSGNATSGDIVSNQIAWVDGFEITGSFASATATATTTGVEITPSAGSWLSKVTVAITNLIASVIKKGETVGGVAGTYSGYPGTEWSGSGLTESACGTAADWEWFEDANGDGDTTDSEDGICVKATAVLNTDNLSWNGAEQVTPSNLGPINAGGGAADSVSSSTASWTINAYKNHVIKITSGTAANCWGRVKSNTATAITVYGSWLGTDYSSNCGTPNDTSVFSVYDDWGQYDNSWIGDWTCTGSFAGEDGEPAFHNYPTTAQVASGKHIALATADCYDGTRDLLPNETDRAVISGTATAADSTSITDSSLALDVNVWIGQKVLITGGTSENAYGFIESNTDTVITVTDWLGGYGDPGTDPASTFSIIYIVPHATFAPQADIDGDDNDDKANNGPLQAEVLNNWKGTRLPSSSDFFGICSCGGTNVAGQYETTCSADKTCGNRGGQVGRTTECIDPAGSEWLSEQHYYNYARVAGFGACSNFSNYNVYSGSRFRSVFRP